MYIMESETEGQRIHRKTNVALTMEQLRWAIRSRDQKILDLGCAAGTTTRLMAELIGPSGKAVGVDISAERLQEASSHHISHSQIEYRVGSAEKIPAKDDEFDVSWARFVFEYLRSPAIAIEEMKRVTKPNGTIAISDLDGNCLWHDPITPDFASELHDAISLLSKSGFDPFIGRKLYNLAHQAGLKNIEVDVRPYHLIAGKACAEIEHHWKMKLDTVSDTLVRLGWAAERATALKDRFLSHLRDESSFTYSTLISVKGIK